LGALESGALSDALGTLRKRGPQANFP
jgi:hypothetical protein